ncbi:MAG TPA: GNAT family N-acetyltransferase [Terracidiphilus sp.]|jgi:predicted GNAT family N-acyltransferase|nr:GNAT family N-acetyltransferase [Terracidiphilus sp.]
MSTKDQPGYYFEPLGEQHDRAAFSCGVEALDNYFRGDPIRQDVSRKTANAFVLTNDGKSVAGFYTLSPISILSVDLPARLAKKLPQRPIGATLIGRMGMDVSLQGNRLGELMLTDALYKAWQASQLVSSWAVVVDAKEGAREFYIKYEFTPFATQPNRLFLPMKKIDLMFG